MIDRVFSTYNQLIESHDYANYTPEQAVSGVNFYDISNAENLTVVFPPWHPAPQLVRYLKNKGIQSSSDVLVYDFNPQILNDDADSVRSSFETIASHVAGELNAIARTKRYSNLNLIGFSLGNVALSMTCEKLNKFDAVSMVVPGSELAQPFWQGIRTQKLKRLYQSRGVTLQELRSSWLNLAPIKHLAALEGKEVKVILGKADRYIPYQSGVNLVEAMLHNGLQPNVTTYSTGHIASIVRYAQSNDL